MSRNYHFDLTYLKLSRIISSLNLMGESEVKVHKVSKNQRELKEHFEDYLKEVGRFEKKFGANPTEDMLPNGRVWKSYHFWSQADEKLAEEVPYSDKGIEAEKRIAEGKKNQEKFEAAMKELNEQVINVHLSIPFRESDFEEIEKGIEDGKIKGVHGNTLIPLYDICSDFEDQTTEESPKKKEKAKAS